MSRRRRGAPETLEEMRARFSLIHGEWRTEKAYRTALAVVGLALLEQASELRRKRADDVERAYDAFLKAREKEKDIKCMVDGLIEGAIDVTSKRGFVEENVGVSREKEILEWLRDRWGIGR